MNSVPNPAGSLPHDHLRWRLQHALGRLPAMPCKGLLSVTLELNSALGSAVPELRDGDLYWSRADAGERLFGRGLAFSHQASGQERLAQLTRVLRQTRAGWLQLDPDECGAVPRLFVGFAFDPRDEMRASWSGFPNAGLFLPELLLHETPTGCRLVFSASAPLQSPHALIDHWLDLLASVRSDTQQRGFTGPQPLQRLAITPEDADWLALAEQAIRDIDRQQLEKLVLYRQVKLGMSTPLPGRELITLMERGYPDCRLFALRRNGRTLVSASPERLLTKQDQTVQVDVLAGTVRRSSCPATDAALAQSLLSEPKIRLEHQLVAEAVSQATQPFCSRLDRPGAPSIRRLRNVQHLWSQMRGSLSEDSHLLELAQALHPTPAVNGTPRNKALQWLRTHGQAERGWYCGAGGWIDVRGDGELNVLLRCALISGNHAELFAGAGLVSGSEAKAELAETELKLDAILNSLTAGR